MAYVCQPNKCISCDTIIKQKGETPEQRAIKGIYNEITLELSNNSKMKVGVCNTCKQSPETIDHNQAFEAIQNFWRTHIKASRLDLFEKHSGQLTATKVLA